MAWQPIPVCLLGESHGQRSLAGSSPWGHKESGTTERLTHTHWDQKDFDLPLFPVFSLFPTMNLNALFLSMGLLWLKATESNSN